MQRYADTVETPLEDVVTVVIRSVGERTEDLCRRLIAEQGVPDANIFVIHEAPFSQAIRTSFKIGLASARAWTLCVDADLLLRPGCVRHMLALACALKPDVCEIQGYVLDKFFRGPRPGGIHLYRTSLLRLALDLIPTEGTDIRPENYMLNRMKAAGYPYKTVPYIVGLHDFEQFYRDIFRKCFVYAWKHLHRVHLFSALWREQAKNDKDYRVALEGFGRGLAHTGEARIDSRQHDFDPAIEALGIDEKGRICVDEWSLARVERTIQEWREPHAFEFEFPMRPSLLPNSGSITWQALSNLRRSFSGPHWFLAWTAWVLGRLGNRCRRLALKTRPSK